VSAAQVVFLRGVNVGGHRSFRPSQLARDLAHLDAVNIGAAGTFVIRGPIGRADLRAEFTRRLPFETELVICPGREVARLLASDPYAPSRVTPDMTRFISVLIRSPRAARPLPVSIPPRGRWLVRIVARQGRFLVGLYRRDLKVIGYLGTLDRVFGVPLTTRTWRTITLIGKALGHAAD
jgi:uncharacterized protein (DUF1697 family)